MTSLLDTWRRSIVAAGDISGIDEIDPCPDQFVQETEQRLEDDEISMSDAVETCHRIAERLRELER